MAVARFVNTIGPLTQAVAPTVPVVLARPSSAVSGFANITFGGAPPPPGPGPTGDTLFMPREELQQRPASGAAWTRMLNYANGAAPDNANIRNQDNHRPAWLLANALVWAKTGNAANRNKVINGVPAFFGSENNSGGQLLGPARSIACIVIAASVAEIDPNVSGNGQTFRGWLRKMLTHNMQTGHKWDTLNFCASDSCTNWGTASRHSQAAIIRYLHLIGEATDAEWNAVTDKFRRYLGDRTRFRHWDSPNQATDASFDPSYVRLESSYGATAAAQTTAVRFANYVGVGAYNNIGGLPFDGLITCDLPRDNTNYNGNYGGFSTSGRNYAWGVMSHIWVQAQIHHYAGQPVWDWSNQAMRRTLAWMQRAGLNPQPQYDEGHFVPFVCNHFYGTSFSQPSAASFGRTFGFSDWIYGT